MKIPKRFKLLGQTIEVKYNPQLINDNDWNGVAIYRRNAIELQPACEAHPKTNEQIEHTFLHELTHFILFYAGSSYSGTDKNNMHTDEGFVDTMAGLLHQALTTAEYEE